MRQLCHTALLLLLAVVASAASMAGCKKDPGAGPTASTAPSVPATPSAPSPGMAAYEHRGIRFEYPRDWTAGKPEGADAVDIKAPAKDEEWQPGIYLELRPAPAAKDLGQAMKDAVENARQQKTAFILTEQKLVTHPAGFKYGRLAYTNQSEGGSDDLTQWELLIPVGSDQRLLVQASALTRTWPAYQPAFAKIIDSIRLPQAGK